MMPTIQYVFHAKIDFSRWDACIQQAFNGNVYALSWYLDAVCEQWDALIVDDYQAVFPIPFKKRMGVSIIYQPFFVQQLGVFSLQPLPESVITQIWKAIPPKFKIGRLQGNSFDNIDASLFKIQRQVNHELNLASDYSILYSNYSENAKRNLKKAFKARLEMRESDACETAIALFQQFKAPTLPDLPPKLYATLRQLFAILKKHESVSVIEAYTEENKVCASVIFTHNGSRLVYLFSGCSPEAYHNGAQFFLVDSIIKIYAGKSMVLDFEGSNDVQLARFYKGFGAVATTYPVVFFEKMFSPVVKILQKMHKI